jgi:anti-sigma factor RsiW
MAHDYTKLMSAALDGRLSERERIEWDAHRATCPHCQRRWQMLQNVDYLFRGARVAAPAPAFTMRFAARLARQQAARQSAQRVWVGAGILAIGALATLATFAWPLAWDLLAFSSVLSDIPAQVTALLQNMTGLAVTLRALGRVGGVLASFVTPWWPAFALIYAGLLSINGSIFVGQINKHWLPTAVMRSA